MDKTSRRRRRRRRPRRRQPRRRPKRRTEGGTGEVLATALENSTADETELVWIDSRHCRASTRGRSGDVSPPGSTTLFVRVLERGRLGAYRTGAFSAAEIDLAIRQAIAQSKTRGTLQGLPHLPADDGSVVASDKLFDSEVEGMDLERAEHILGQHRRRREVAVLEWGDASVLVLNSRNLRRQAKVTYCSLKVRCGKSPGAGHAAASTRYLQQLDPASVFERARDLHGRGKAAEAPHDRSALVLAPEATARLFSMLNRAAFTASSYYDGVSFLREHMGTQVFDRGINLLDDATDSDGLPFPFDLEGTMKKPVPLIVDGTPKTPALDQRQAALLGLPPTGHAVAGNDAQAQNLFLRPGDASHEDLLEAAGEGVFVGWLEDLECFDPPRVRFRAVARGVRRIEEGRLGAPLPDLVWEDSLLRSLSNVLGIGSRSVTWSLEGFLGGISTPALALGDVAQPRPLALL